jgi:hypothetical protein
LDGLTNDEKAKITELQLKYHAKQLAPSHVKRLTSSAQTQNPLYLKVILDELCVVGKFEMLDQQLQNYLAVPDIPSLYEKVFKRWEDSYEQDHKGLVKKILSLICVSRGGVTENELLQICGIPYHRWSSIYIAMKESLINRYCRPFAEDFITDCV